MIVQSLPPLAPALRPFVRSFMLMEIQSSEYLRDSTLTIPACDITALLFPLSGCEGYALDKISSEQVRLDGTYLHGQISRRSPGGVVVLGDVPDKKKHLALFSIIFTPIGIHLFLQQHLGAMENITNTFISAEYLFENVRFLHEELQEIYNKEYNNSASSQSPQQECTMLSVKIDCLIECVEKKLVQWFHAKAPQNILSKHMYTIHQAAYICRRLADTHGKTSMQTIAGELELSERHVLRIMQSTVGVSGKTFGEIQRFMYASRLLCNAVANAPAGQPITSETLHNAIHQAGYYDQSHCIRDFKRFSGSTPLQFLRERHVLAERLIGADSGW